MEKGRLTRGMSLKLSVGDHPFALYAPGSLNASTWIRAFGAFLTACSLPADEAALILVRFYTSPPANPGGLAEHRDGWNQITGPDSTSSVAPAGILVNDPLVLCGRFLTLGT